MTSHAFFENEHGVWCPNCGNCIRPSHWNTEDYPLNEDSECGDCGFPDVTEEWIEENT